MMKPITVLAGLLATSFSVCACRTSNLQDATPRTTAGATEAVQPADVLENGPKRGIYFLAATTTGLTAKRCGILFAAAGAGFAVSIQAQDVELSREVEGIDFPSSGKANYANFGVASVNPLRKPQRQSWDWSHKVPNYPNLPGDERSTTMWWDAEARILSFVTDSNFQGHRNQYTLSLAMDDQQASIQSARYTWTQKSTFFSDNQRVLMDCGGPFVATPVEP